MLYLLVVGCFLLGYLLQQPRLLGARNSTILLQQINRWNLSLALPALILVNIPRLTFSFEHLFAVLTPWCIFALAFYGVKLLALRLNINRADALVLTLMIGLGNTAFVGIPLIALFLGEEAVLGAVVYDQLGCFLLLSIVASTLIATHSDTSISSSFLAKLRPILRFPPFICLMLALLLAMLGGGVFLDSWLWLGVEQLLSMIALTLLPLGMLTVGLQFRFKVEKSALRFIATVVGIKMLLLPLAVLVAAKLLSVAPDVARPTIVQAAMPPQVTVSLMLMAANIAPRLVAAVLSFATLLSILTLPLWFYVLNYY